MSSSDVSSYPTTAIFRPAPRHRLAMFTVSFSRPNVQFLQGTSTSSLGILSPASVAEGDDERCSGVVGSGPFVLESYTMNQATVLTKRVGYDLAVSSLSFLGYGAPPPAAEWGSLIAEGRNYIAASWWLCAMPGFAIAATVLSVNRISHALDGQWSRTS